MAESLEDLKQQLAVLKVQLAETGGLPGGNPRSKASQGVALKRQIEALEIRIREMEQAERLSTASRQQPHPPEEPAAAETPAFDAAGQGVGEASPPLPRKGEEHPAFDAVEQGLDVPPAAAEQRPGLAAPAGRRSSATRGMGNGREGAGLLRTGTEHCRHTRRAQTPGYGVKDDTELLAEDKAKEAKASEQASKELTQFFLGLQQAREEDEAALRTQIETTTEGKISPRPGWIRCSACLTPSARRSRRSPDWWGSDPSSPASARPSAKWSGGEHVCAAPKSAAEEGGGHQGSSRSG